jgi:hypothetical protein
MVNVLYFNNKMTHSKLKQFSQSAVSTGLHNPKHVYLLCRLAGVERPLLGQMVAFLDIFKESSLKLECCKTPTLHLALPYFYKLLQHCKPDPDEDISEMVLIKQSAMNFLQSKFVLHPLHHVAAALNPKMKSLKMITETERSAIYDNLRSKVVAVTIAHNARAQPLTGILKLPSESN